MKKTEFHFAVNDKVTLTNYAINVVLNRNVYKPLRQLRRKGVLDVAVKIGDENTFEMTSSNPRSLAPEIDDIWEVKGTWKKDGTVFCEIQNLRNGTRTYLSQNFMLLNQDYEGYAD